MRFEDIFIDPKWLEPVKLPNSVNIADFLKDLEDKQNNISAKIAGLCLDIPKANANANFTSITEISKIRELRDSVNFINNTIKEHGISPQLSSRIIRERIEEISRLKELIASNSNFAFPNVIIRTPRQKDSIGEKKNQRNFTILSDHKSASSALVDCNITESDIKTSLKRISPEQEEFLMKIAIATNNGNNKVRFAPSRWFTGMVITKSVRASWSRCRKRLEKRNLIIIESEHHDILYKSNRGNSIAYVSLTPLGCLAVKWLINCKS